MFTGIVEDTGTVRDRTETEDGLRLRIAVDGFDDLHHGQSISVSGVCLTVEEYDTGTDNADGDDWFEVFLERDGREDVPRRDRRGRRGQRRARDARRRAISTATSCRATSTPSPR